MKLTLRRPSRRRAKGVGAALGAVGSAVGALPVTVRPGTPDRSKALRIVAPVTLVLVLIATVGVARRRRNRAAVEMWEEPAPSYETPSTVTEENKAEAIGSQRTAAETARAAGAETPAAAEAAETTAAETTDGESAT